MRLFFQGGMFIKRDYLTAWKQTTLFVCLVRSASPSPRLQSFSTLHPLGEVLKFDQIAVFQIPNTNNMVGWINVFCVHQNMNTSCFNEPGWQSWNWRASLTASGIGLTSMLFTTSSATKKQWYQVQLVNIINDNVLPNHINALLNWI